MRDDKKRSDFRKEACENEKRTEPVNRGGTENRINKGFHGAGSVFGTATAMMTAALFFVCVTVSPAAGMRVYAFQDPNPLGTTVDEVETGKTMKTNNGRVTTNNGTVTTNNGVVTTNNGGVETNNGGVDTNNGVVTTNNREVMTNNGEITTNNDYVRYNSDTVATSNGTIVSNDNNGTVTTNTGKIEINHGTVTTNTGTFDDNYGTVTTNTGTIEYNYATVTTNTGTIENNHNNGTVTTNTGTIDNNFSTVYNYQGGEVTDNWGGATVYNYEGGKVIVNHNGGTVHNYGGTVSTGGSGTVYFYYSVEISGANTRTTYDNSFENNQNKNWLQEHSTGTITITPASGYRIDSIDVGTTGATAVQNADGTWTITVSNIQNNIRETDWRIISSAVINVTPAPTPAPAQTPAPAPVPLRFVLQSASGGSGNNTVSAPVPVPQTKQNFDSAYYADNNPDLYEAFGYDHDLLWNHYVTYGKAEGRDARFIEGIHADTALIKEDFDAKRYADNYPDLLAVYGYDEDALWNHYISFGLAEGRMAFRKQA